jgi:hypothetical protein
MTANKSEQGGWRSGPPLSAKPQFEKSSQIKAKSGTAFDRVIRTVIRPVRHPFIGETTRSNGWPPDSTEAVDKRKRAGGAPF